VKSASIPLNYPMPQSVTGISVKTLSRFNLSSNEMAQFCRVLGTKRMLRFDECALFCTTGKIRTG
jgi:hypothetical protein